MMSNNNTQFNLLYIATKTSKSDPQNDTKFSALENGNVYGIINNLSTAVGCSPKLFCSCHGDIGLRGTECTD